MAKPSIEVVEGDLLNQDVEVIVNAWNRNIIPWWLLLPQGVSGAIKRRAGKAGGTSSTSIGHPSQTPYDVAAWWVKYLLPQDGVLLDCFAGSGTMLAAGLDFGASKVIGIEQQKKYLKIAEKRIVEGY